MDFWFEAVLNAVSLAVGVAAGSYITFHLTKNSIKKLFNEISNSEAGRNFQTILERLKELLDSPESRAFFINLSKVLIQFTKAEPNDSPLDLEVRLPEKPTSSS